jgi:hypothetical protein
MPSPGWPARDNCPRRPRAHRADAPSVSGDVSDVRKSAAMSLQCCGSSPIQSPPQASIVTTTGLVGSQAVIGAGAVLLSRLHSAAFIVCGSGEILYANPLGSTLLAGRENGQALRELLRKPEGADHRRGRFRIGFMPSRCHSTDSWQR